MLIPQIYRPQKRQPVIIPAFFAVLFLLWTLCGIAFSDSGEKRSGPLKIAYSRYMPFSFEGANKEPRGILIDIWELWSSKTGTPVEFVLLPREAAMKKTASGLIDINAFMYRTADRENRYHFSTPLMNLSTYLYIGNLPGSDEKAADVDKLDDIDGLSTGVVAKDFTRIYLKQHLPALNPILYKDHESLVKAAINGDIQAFLMEGPVASTYIAKHNGLDRLTRLENPMYTKPLVAGVKHGRRELIQQVDKGLALIRPEETLRIVRDWTGKVEPHLFRPRPVKLKIATSIDNMPFHFADDEGHAVGYFIDLWKLWSKKTGIEVAFISAPWAESLAMVKSGQADVHAGCFFSVQRDRFLDYAGVLSDCETHFFFHESIFGLKNLKDLRGFQIGILDQDYAVEFVNRELPGAAIKIYDSHKALFEGVANGDVRVFICDTPTALYFLEQMNLLPAFRYHPAHPLYKKPFYSAVKEGNTSLVEQINAGFERITAEERAAIERRWMGASDLIRKDGLVIATARAFPPFSMLNAEGRPSGLFIDMWESWSQKTGKPVAFRMYDRVAAVHALKDGIVDVVSFLPPARSTSGWTQKSQPFYRLNWYLYRHKKTFARQPDILSSQSVLGVVSASREEEWLTENRPGVRINAFDTTRQMILAAAGGTIDGFLALPQEMAVLPDRLGLPDSFIQSSYPLFQQPMGGVIRNFNPELIKLIEEGFDAIEQEERIRIETRWLKDRQVRVFNSENDRILLTGDEKKWLLQHYDLNPPIRLGVNPDWLPFEFMESNRSYRGMVSDYVDLLNRRLGLNMTRVEILPMPEKRLKKDYARFDVIPSAASFEPDLPDMLKTRPYLEFPWVIINKQQAPLIGGIRDFYGKTMAVIGRYAITDGIRRNHPEIRIMEVRTAREGLDAVVSGKAHGYVENLAVAGYQIQDRNHHGLKVAAATDFSGTGLTFSVRKDWPELVSILNKGIAGISDAEHDRIRQKWFSVRFEHQVNTAYVRELFIKIGIGSLLLAGLFLFWNRQIRKRRQAAEAANLNKTKFLAGLSHEVRTPLNAILGMTEMTLRSTRNLQHKKNLTLVKDSALHLLDVITDILDFSTIEAGKMRIQNKVFHLQELLTRMEHTWKFLAGEKGLWFNLITDDNLPLTVRTDPVRLQQVLENLISNAVKFTHTGGVDLSVRPVSSESQKIKGADTATLVFTIKDTGIGIEKDQQERIFERFTQAETSVTRNYGGTGLGLSICRETAALMNGTLDLESLPGRGSSFYLTLPLEVVFEPDRSHLCDPLNRLPSRIGMRADPQIPERGLTLLLAEDDPVNASVFHLFLSNTDHEIIHVDDGKKAIDMLTNKPVDLVFMDIEMPRMDGLSACTAIRDGAAGLKNNQVPIIAMSAHVLEEFKRRSRVAGMDEFIAKPVDPDHLVRVISRFCPGWEKTEPAKSVQPNEKGDSLALSPSKEKQGCFLDRDRALASLGGNETLLKRILDIFVQETPGQLEGLKKALIDENIPEVVRYAHTLKGSAGRIFAMECAGFARDLEKLSQTENPAGIAAHATKTIEKFEDLLTCLSEDRIS